MSPTAAPHDLARLELELTRLVGERVLESRNGFDPDADLYDEGLDSMALMQLLVFLEQDYGVAIAESDLSRKNFSTVRHLAHLVSAQLQQKCG